MHKKIISIIAILAVSCGLMHEFVDLVYADDTTSNLIVYEAKLLDKNSFVVTTPHTLRFSFWSNVDWVATDENADSSINTTAPNYGGWNEVQTVKPNKNGIFSVKLGSVTPLPQIDFSKHKYIQVEVKEDGTSDANYQLMDVTGDNGADTEDRQVIGSASYAKNTERLANKSIGDTEGDIALLGPNGQWTPDQIPGGTDEENFILDYDNTYDFLNTGEIKLQFGDTLNRYLAYDTDNQYFYFNDDVMIDGDLTVSGTINGGILYLIGTTNDTFTINTGGNQLILDSAGLTDNRHVTFDDADTVVVGEDNVQTLTNKTIDADFNTILNLDWDALKKRDDVILLIPEYSGYSVEEDGTNNQATLKLGQENNKNHNFYVLTSNENSLNDLDLVVRMKLPNNFVEWKANPIQLYLKTDTKNDNNNNIKISLLDTENNLVNLTDADHLCSDVADRWDLKNITMDTVGTTWTKNQYFTLRIKMKSRQNNKTMLGEILLNYESK